MRQATLPARGTALLLIDVINDLAFAGSEALIDEAEPMALRVAALKRRAAHAGIPVIYVNDNLGQWRSDFRHTVTHCTASSSPGRVVSRRLRPTTRDYFVLKPKHSGFYDTTLDTLLVDLRIKRLILVGIAGNICVLFTANDAHMRGFRLYVPEDCIVSNTPEDNAYALRQIENVMKGHTFPSPRLRFRSRVRRRSSSSTARGR
jgi:nicotinamidase-related amidase